MRDDSRPGPAPRRPLPRRSSAGWLTPRGGAPPGDHGQGCGDSSRGCQSATGSLVVSGKEVGRVSTATAARWARPGLEVLGYQRHGRRGDRKGRSPRVDLGGVIDQSEPRCQCGRGHAGRSTARPRRGRGGAVLMSATSSQAAEAGPWPPGDPSTGHYRLDSHRPMQLPEVAAGALVLPRQLPGDARRRWGWRRCRVGPRSNGQCSRPAGPGGSHPDRLSGSHPASHPSEDQAGAASRTLPPTTAGTSGPVPRCPHAGRRCPIRLQGDAPVPVDAPIDRRGL